MLFTLDHYRNSSHRKETSREAKETSENRAMRFKNPKKLVLSNKEKLDLLEREIEQAPDITRRKKAKDKLYALKKRIKADFHKLYLKNLITK